MAGKTVLVTGSTDGVGRYVAARLASAGASVLIHGRAKRAAWRRLLGRPQWLAKCFTPDALPFHALRSDVNRLNLYASLMAHT